MPNPTEPNQKIIDKLRKLKAMAEGAEKIGSEAEAQAFAAMFQKLLTDNMLEMTDIEFERFEQEQPVGEHYINYSKYPHVKVRSRRTRWVEKLADIVARAHFCRFIVYSGTSRITLVGRKQDTQVAEYMFVTLQRTAEQLADKEYARFSIECVKQCVVCGSKRETHKLFNHEFEPNWARCRGYRPAFLDAFISRLAQRYEEERRARQGNITAMVRINHSLVKVKEFLNRKDGRKKLYHNAGSLTRFRSSNLEGSRDGHRAANDINLRANAVSANGAIQKELPK